MGSDLKQSHKDMVESYLSNKDNKIYMLTIARDGEDPVRSILFYQNSIEAAAAYNKYTDFVNILITNTKCTFSLSMELLAEV